jgi:5'(3')-deoxyribonucleotidase
MSIREYPDLIRVYVDMDGVVADFEGGFKSVGMTATEFKKLPGIYRDLKPIPGAIDGLKWLLDNGYFPMMLTKIPSENPLAATEKIQWLYEHAPFMEDHIIISPDKGCVGTHRDFLIDDFPAWANAHQFEGTVIRFGNSPTHGWEPRRYQTTYKPPRDHHASNWDEVKSLIKLYGTAK